MLIKISLPYFPSQQQQKLLDEYMKQDGIIIETCIRDASAAVLERTILAFMTQSNPISKAVERIRCNKKLLKALSSLLLLISQFLILWPALPLVVSRHRRPSIHPAPPSQFFVSKTILSVIEFCNSIVALLSDILSSPQPPSEPPKLRSAAALPFWTMGTFLFCKFNYPSQQQQQY